MPSPRPSPVSGAKAQAKTYLATVLAEQMLALPAQIVVLDPVGNWWGLRVAADGLIVVDRDGVRADKETLLL